MLRKIVKQFPLARPYLLVTAIAVVLLWPTWERLFVQWLRWEQVLAHGLPTFVIFLALLVWHPPRPLEQQGSRPSVAGCILLLLSVLLWALLELIRIDTLAFLMLPPVLLSVCWALLGFRSSLRFLPYVLLFSLSLPIWADLVPLLIELATVVVSSLVSAMGITALIEGANITLPYGRLVIADGCSGIRYFAISILLAMITAILNDYRWKSWCVTVAIAMAIGLLVNWVRITALVVIAYESNMESSLVADHETFGWIIYAAFVIPAMLLAPVHRREGMPMGPAPQLPVKGLIVVIAAFLVGPVGITLAHSQATDSAPWDLASPDANEVAPSQLPLSLTLPEILDHTVWQTGPGSWVSLAQLQKLNQGDKLVPYLPRTMDSGRWFLADTHDQGRLKVYQDMRNRSQVVVATRYLVGTRSSHSYTRAKLLQIPATLSGQNRFALLTVESRCRPGSCDNALERARTIMDSITLKPAN